MNTTSGSTRKEEKYSKTWLGSSKRILVNGRVREFDPTERRVEERAKIAKILASTELRAIDRLDMVINFFRDKYEPDPRIGLSYMERRRLFRERGGQCMWCLVPLRVNEFTVEHVVSLADGGTNDWANLGVACEPCNNEREHETLTRQGFLRAALKGRCMDAIEPYEPNTIR